MPQIERIISQRMHGCLLRLGIMEPEFEPQVRPSARPEFGDYSSPACLTLANKLGQNPKQLALRLADELHTEDIPHVAKITVTEPGFINFILDYSSFAEAVLSEVIESGTHYGDHEVVGLGKVVIEHTNINTNKAAHIGHLRNACIGDTVARILRKLGYPVEVQNYVDDTGVQVADVVVGLRDLGIKYDGQQPFDHFCSQVYVEVCKRYEQEPDLLENRRRVLQAIEAGDNEIADFAKGMSERIAQAHLATMARVGISYDLLSWESDILKLGFWQQAFELLRSRELIVKLDNGPLAGCWVLPFNEHERVDVEGEEASAKVLVKSDDVATYTAKDIAYQLWKFGLLGMDFYYHVWATQADGRTLWSTIATIKDAAVDSPAFGHAKRVINVIDARQSYLQNVVRESLFRLGFQEQAENSIHLAYDLVSLSREAARELGIEVSDDRALYALSGRHGIEVRVDDLLDLVESKLSCRTSSAQIARQVAVGAVRYYLLRFGLSQIIAFDFEEALRTVGDTGVYLQYAHARACSLLRKVPGEQEDLSIPAKLSLQEKNLAKKIAEFPGTLEVAGQKLAPAILAQYAFDLATAFTDFYEHTGLIYRLKNRPLRLFRRALVDALRQTLANVLETLGIPAPQSI